MGVSQKGENFVQRKITACLSQRRLPVPDICPRRTERYRDRHRAPSAGLGTPTPLAMLASTGELTTICS